MPLNGARKECSMGMLPDTSTKSISPVGDITPADIAEFRNRQDSMISNDAAYQHMESSRYDAVPRGIASEPAYIPETTPEGPQSVEQQAYPPEVAPEPQNDDWKRKYGTSENEKGEWRRVALETQQRNEELMRQQMDITNRLTQALTQQNAPPPGPPPRIFPDRSPTELLTWGEMEEILANEVVPVINQRMQWAEQRATDVATARAQRYQASWDVTPAEEAQATNQLRQTLANFDNRFTESEKLALIGEKARAQRPVGNGSAFNPTPPTATPVGRVAGNAAPATQPVFVDPNRAIRRATYIESAAPAQMSMEPTAQANPQARFAQELAALDTEAMAKNGRKATAQQYEALLSKYGIGRVNDWGSGVTSR